MPADQLFFLAAAWRLCACCDSAASSADQLFFLAAARRLCAVRLCASWSAVILWPLQGSESSLLCLAALGQLMT